MRKTYEGDIELFAFYCSDLDKIYVVPVEEVGEKVEILLRVEPTKNCQKKGIRWASEYELGA